MFHGQVLAICIGSVRREPMQEVENIELQAGQGIVGDRYRSKPEQGITLIESEALEGAQRDYQLDLSHRESRRNLLTTGVPLNHLVGKQFQVGATILEGLELCEPCSHLERLTGKKVVRALLHRGGLRARIIQGGAVRIGDKIAPASQTG